MLARRCDIRESNVNGIVVGPRFRSRTVTGTINYSFIAISLLIKTMTNEKLNFMNDKDHQARDLEELIF